MPIRLNEVTVQFERWGQRHVALDRLSLQVADGEWLLLTGHNGSGKSTVLNLLARHVLPASGSVTIDAPADAGASRFGSRLYFVRQDPLAGTAGNLTLEENLRVGLTGADHRQSTRAERAFRVQQAMEKLRLVSRGRQLIRDFSGGERQQVTLLVATLRKPRLLLLDEPFSALDPERTATALGLIKQMNEAGSTVLQVTHDATMITALGLRTVVLHQGRVDRETKANDGQPTD